MRMSRLFVETLREVPADIALPGYQLLVRGGFVRSPALGSYAFLPLGAAVRRRVEVALGCALTEMDGQEVCLPLLQPTDLATPAAGMPSEAWNGARPLVVPLAGEHYRQWALCGSHERYLMALARHVVQSYRQLPALLYHVWQPLQADLQPNKGLFAGRETRVLDAYSLHRTDADREDLRYRMLDEFSHLIELAGLRVCRVANGDNLDAPPAAYQLVWPAPAGDVVFLACSVCGWSHDLATARTRRLGAGTEEMGQLHEVATPDCRTIADLCAWLGVLPERTAKALFLLASGAAVEDRFVVAMVRGDTELSEAKLKRLLGVETVRPASEADIREAGAEPGYGSPVGLHGVDVVVDDLIPGSPNLVAGANRSGYHLMNVNYDRDFSATKVADIALAQNGDGCPACGGQTVTRQGVELASAECLADDMIRSLNAVYLDSSGAAQSVVAGRYRFYIDRLIAAVCEVQRDDHGLVWPSAIAPYDVSLLTLGKRSQVVDDVAEALYVSLTAVGARVLYDDRDERAGVKLNDADLQGMPLRIVVGERGVRSGAVEVKHRRTGEVVTVPIVDLTPYIGALL